MYRRFVRRVGSNLKQKVSKLYIHRQLLYKGDTRLLKPGSHFLTTHDVPCRCSYLQGPKINVLCRLHRQDFSLLQNVIFPEAYSSGETIPPGKALMEFYWTQEMMSMMDAEKYEKAFSILMQIKMSRTRKVIYIVNMIMWREKFWRTHKLKA